MPVNCVENFYASIAHTTVINPNLDLLIGYLQA